MTYVSRIFQSIIWVGLSVVAWWVFSSFVIAQIALFGGVAVMGVREIWEGKLNLFSDNPQSPQTENKNKSISWTE